MNKIKINIFKKMKIQNTKVHENCLLVYSADTNRTLSGQNTAPLLDQQDKYSICEKHL
jgi:hypothetical protein